MSAITKIFVVLHVVVSLLLAAGLIVFVNRQENYKIAAKNSQDQTAQAKAYATVLEQDIAKVSAQKAVSESELASQIATLGNDLKNSESINRTKDGTIAELQSNINQMSAEKVSLTNQLGVKDTEIAARIKNGTDLQAKLDDREKKYVDLNLAYNTLTNERDVFKRGNKYLAENNTELKTQLSGAEDLLKKYGITPGSNIPPAKGVMNHEPNVNINGVVRDTRSINGVPFATISLGSADAVTHGMQFNVIDPVQGQFLGYLIVDQVNVHDATGRLEGPKINLVRPSVTEVRTQLN